MWVSPSPKDMPLLALNRLIRFLIAFMQCIHGDAVSEGLRDLMAFL